MSVKAMVFIDGGWLYKSRSVLFEKIEKDRFHNVFLRGRHQPGRNAVAVIF